MKRLFLLIIFMLGFVLADSPIAGNAYVISALGIKNTSDVVSYVSGDTSVSGNANYVLAPQVIVYQDSLEYVGSYTPFTGCLNSQHYTNGSPDGMCITGIINDLTTGGVDKALSAEQGKILNNKVSAIENSYAKLTTLDSYVQKGDSIIFDGWFENSASYPAYSPSIYFGGNSDSFRIYQRADSGDNNCLVIEFGDNLNDYIEFRVAPWEGEGTPHAVMTLDGYGNLTINGNLNVLGNIYHKSNLIH